jgi:hypothetical protein
MIINIIDCGNSNSSAAGAQTARNAVKRKKNPTGKVISMARSGSGKIDQEDKEAINGIDGSVNLHGQSNVFHLYFNGDFSGNTTINFSFDGLRAQSL